MANRTKLAIWTDRLVRAAVTGVFLWAGIAKANDPAAFAAEIANYRLVPSPAALVVAPYLPWLEIIAAIGLWIRPVRAGALRVLLALAVVFLVAIGLAWGRGLDLGCGCFGGSGGGPTNHAVLVGRDLALLVALVWLGRHPRSAPMAGRSGGAE